MAKPRPNALQAALNHADDDAQDNSGQDQAALPAKGNKPRGARQAQGRGRDKPTVLIGGHFAPEVKHQLRIIAAEEGTTSQALIAEALDLLFVKKGKARIL